MDTQKQRAALLTLSATGEKCPLEKPVRFSPRVTNGVLENSTVPLFTQKVGRPSALSD